MISSIAKSMKGHLKTTQLIKKEKHFSWGIWFKQEIALKPISAASCRPRIEQLQKELPEQRQP